jgi:hypothetical protein
MIGMAVQRVVMMNEFEQRNWTSGGHGHYLMSNKGTLYSHSDSTINNTTDGWEYGQGDTVNMEFDTASMELHLWNGNQSEILKVVPVANRDCYRFVIYLLGKGETVEMLACD